MKQNHEYSRKNSHIDIPQVQGLSVDPAGRGEAVGDPVDHEVVDQLVSGVQLVQSSVAPVVELPPTAAWKQLVYVGEQAWRGVWHGDTWKLMDLEVVAAKLYSY